MPPQAFQNDEEIAAVLTFVRNSFGNSAPSVTPDMVAALRSEAGKPLLTVEDLIPPPSQLTTGAPIARSNILDDDESSGWPWWAWAFILFWVCVCVIPLVKQFKKRDDES